MKLAVVTGASFVSSRQVNVPMLVSNTALAGFGCGLCSASFPHALNEKQTTMHIHNNKILRIANPPLFSGNFVPDTFSQKALATFRNFLWKPIAQIFSAVSFQNKTLHILHFFIIYYKQKRQAWKVPTQIIPKRKFKKKKGCRHPFSLCKSNTSLQNS